MQAGARVAVNNNIFTLTGPGERVAVRVSPSATGDIDVRQNIVFGAQSFAPSNILGFDQLYDVDPLLPFGTAEPIPMLGSPAIDAGINAAMPAFLTEDYNGVRRYVDRLDTPNTGDNGGVPGMGVIDMGVYELGGGITCNGKGDYNRDGRLDANDKLDAVIDAADVFELLDLLRRIDAGC
ncbi:MAG: hypothetical protein AAFU70_01525 [Planctomycetota bacterium]